MTIDGISYKLEESYLYITVNTIFTSYEEILNSPEALSNKVTQGTSIMGGGKVTGNKFILIKDNIIVEVQNKIQFKLLNIEDRDQTKDLNNPKGNISSHLQIPTKVWLLRE